MMEQNHTLRFDGSIWCNLDVALRSVDQFYRQFLRPADLTVIEWYILRALFERDGQHASELARAVGRAATSFTPNLDKLQKRGLIERRPDETDRRAVRIYLKDNAHGLRNDVLESARVIDEKIRQMFPPGDFETFQLVLHNLQNLTQEPVE
ncbi:MAG: MarR family transcriptional regulator [Chitinophagaceae bacterium]|nr:MarR family transcriptional regulator [Anaerolineae bacterium]